MPADFVESANNGKLAPFHGVQKSMSATPIINLSGYRFVHLDDLLSIQEHLKAALGEAGMQGSVMLASEGINVSLAGSAESVARSRAIFDEDPRFANLWLKETESDYVPSVSYTHLRAHETRGDLVCRLMLE